MGIASAATGVEQDVEEARGLDLDDVGKNSIGFLHEERHSQTVGSHVSAWFYFDRLRQFYHNKLGNIEGEKQFQEDHGKYESLYYKFWPKNVEKRKLTRYYLFEDYKLLDWVLPDRFIWKDGLDRYTAYYDLVKKRYPTKRMIGIADMAQTNYNKKRKERYMNSFETEEQMNSFLKKINNFCKNELKKFR